MMSLDTYPHRVALLGWLEAVLLLVAQANGQTVAERVTAKPQPAVFQAWNPIDMPSVPLATDAERLTAAAKHSLLWEEPVSQLGYGVDLVLGAVWDHQHGGLATKFTAESAQRALANRGAMLKQNPHMVFLLEVRWRDAPGSFLPEDSPFWKRNPDGSRVLGWDNGPEPYYLMNPDQPEFVANIARQCKIAIESGIYDGVMFDWDGYLPIVRRVRAELGDEPLIVVNIHDRLELGKQYGDLINGAFMELAPPGPNYEGQKLGTWESTRQALLGFETMFRAPRVNCLETWGQRDDLRRMRAVTTLGLTHSDGYVLYADPNPLASPDHLHNWYPLWDARLGAAQGPAHKRDDGGYQREFADGTVVYNPLGNGEIKVKFDTARQRASDASQGQEFNLQDCDGDLFLPLPR